MHIIIPLDELHTYVGREVAVSGWHELTQQRINAFAECTGDRQWLHVDPERARLDSPFGGTIAHGFLLLAVVPLLIRDAMVITGASMSVNYGLDRVRFITPVPSGSRIRARFVLAALDERPGARQAAWQITIERDGEPRPCATVQSLTRYYRGSASAPIGGVEEHA